MNIKYLIRLDDACPFMDKKKWQRIEDILDKYSVIPLVGIIPNNEDPKTKIEQEDFSFWEKAHVWEDKGWVIALHGYNHVCESSGGMNGINPMWMRSEFAGLSLEQQKEKIRNGYDKLKSHGFDPKFFFAPSHTFDKNTLKALETETAIRVISDTIALKPYKKDGFVFIPQITGHCVKMRMDGIYTFCFHPNTMKDKDFIALESFLANNHQSFVSFSDINLSNVKGPSLMDKMVRIAFFTLRKMKGLK